MRWRSRTQVEWDFLWKAVLQSDKNVRTLEERVKAIEETAVRSFQRPPRGEDEAIEEIQRTSLCQIIGSMSWRENVRVALHEYLRAQK